LATWVQGKLALGAGAALKRHLLEGSLRLQPDEIRDQGVGNLLGRVIESEALESLALSGGLTGLTSIIELAIAAVVLALGAQNIFLALLLVLWTAVAGFLARRQIRERQSWTEVRLEITNDLMERMTGHRTRLAQQARERWHDTEDDSLEGYLEGCRKMDRSLITLLAIVPRGWLILGLLCLFRVFLYGGGTSTSLAVAFGGILFARAALKRLTDSLVYLSGAVVAWRQLKPLFEAAGRRGIAGSAELSLSRGQVESNVRRNEVVMEAHDLVFRHEGRAENVLDGCNVRIREKDRILLEGPSGGGKSTVMSILAGIREPNSGLVMLRGLDRQTVGSRAWRRAVAAAPQFHENHVLSGTLAFNLLMGRRWPPRQEDFEEAEKVCREVGLGDLLNRMPSGLLQQVGETGWQMSHGERSRLFLARALLQGADVVVLDESFGALDSESLKQSMDCALERSEALMVIAHP
jgi:ATP-binding cassette subfamily B protein